MRRKHRNVPDISKIEYGFCAPFISRYYHATDKAKKNVLKFFVSIFSSSLLCINLYFSSCKWTFHIFSIISLCLCRCKDNELIVISLSFV